jgi:hypothetical protein
MLIFYQDDFQKIVTYQRQVFSIQVGDQAMEFSPEELILIAPKVLEHFQSRTSPFIINLVQASITQSDLVLSIQKLKYLFLDNCQIEVSQKNQLAFSFLAEHFDNNELLKICEDVSFSMQPIFYSLSLNSLLMIKKTLLKKYEDFKVNFDDEIFKVNHVFMEILSSRCDKLIRSGEFQLSVCYPDGIDKSQFRFLFHSIISCFHGHPVDLSKFDPTLIRQIAECFEISKFDHLFEQQLISDMSVCKVLEYLKKNILGSLKQTFITKAASLFQEILEDKNLRSKAQNLPIDVLEKILSDSSLMLSSEDDLFDFVMGQIKVDENSVILFKHLRLVAVQQKKVYEYFLHRPFDQLSSEETLSLLHFLTDDPNMKPLSTIGFSSQNSSPSVKEFYEIFKKIDEKRGQLSRTDFISQLCNQKNRLEQFCKILIEVGMNYIRKSGSRVPQEWEKAVNLFKIAADSGSIEGKWRYGRCLSNGLGVKVNIEVGRRILKEIMNVSQVAKFFYAITFHENSYERKKIIQELIEKNDPNGFWSLGWVYLKDKTPELQEKGRNYLLDAARLGRKSYIDHLEEDFKHGKNGFKKDDQVAKELKGLREKYEKNNYLDEEFFYWS